MTYTITLNKWSNILNSGYQGFDPAFDCSVLNYDESITDLSYKLEVSTSDQDAINYLKSE